MKPTTTGEENVPLHHPTSSSTIKRKSAERSRVEERSAGAPAQKRRRRAFSCLSCQKLKCRCEYDPGALGCHRCQTLRVECSLRPEYAESPSNPTSEQSIPSVEERLRNHEEALREIKSMVKDLSSRVQPDNDNRARPQKENPGPEYFANPADKGTQSAPVVVLRGISEQVRGGYRRLLSIVNLDLVQLQLLDEQTANELLQLFFRYQGHNLLVCGIEDLNRGSEARKASAFLYSVCCLIGIVYRDDICGTLVHRKVYEHVRITLGQALLSSPLNLEEINAVLIMSNNANTPSSNGSEYVDSWLLTGYCAQQAMLSISFSNVVKNIKQGSSTTEDHRAIHLWSTICLHHLHWAATTGRPSIIPTAYVNQCNVLLSFYQATMQDGMLVAEILLYSTLHRKLDHHTYISDGDECEEFLDWKQKWNHLLALSTSSMLRIGYHAACLILAVRSLEEAGHAIKTKTFLSDGDIATDNASDDESHSRNERRVKETVSDDGSPLRAKACKFAMLVLQTFLEMPSFLMDATPTCLCLCIGYCGLLLAHYDESESKIPDQISLSLITQLDEWIRSSPGKAWSNKYGALAKHKIESRIDSRRRTNASHQVIPVTANPRDRNNIHGKTDSLASLDDQNDHGHGSENTEYHTDSQIPSAVQSLETDVALPSIDMTSEDAIFPSMEDFFGGGFLDFMS
ncbi:hypothetical protein F4779DRAFT_591311 [Xylariaceae sp. FL0662B]|nr:hypothetical protein F4779DRAFT_591311 [Xylariaceae sp. FL0662B]